MSYRARKPRIRGTSRRSLWQAEERKLRKLDTEFRTIMDEIEVDPTKAVMDTQKVLARLLVSFIRNEGFVLPKRKHLFELWVAARPAFGDRHRFDPDDSISDRVRDLLMVVEAVLVSELTPLPNNGFHLQWCGRPKTFHTDEARLITLLGHVAATFVVSIGSDNDDARFMGHSVQVRRALPQNRIKPMAPITARPSLTTSLSRLLTRFCRRPLKATQPVTADLAPRTREGSTEGPTRSRDPHLQVGSDDDRFDDQDIPF